MTATVEAAGVALALEDSGEPGNAAVVLAHGTATDRTLWRETLAALGGARRTIAYDRRAYGESGAPEPYGGTTVEEQAEDLAALIGERGAAPAILCGHDLGALVCLDLLLRHPELACGAVLIEPPLFALSDSGPEAASKLREAIEDGARDGGPGGAVDAWLTAVGGPEALALLGAGRVSAAHRAARAFAADIAAAPAWDFTRARLRAMDAPVEVLAGARGSAISLEAARALVELLPAARLTEPAAGHLVPVEAPEAVAEAIAAVAAR